MKKLVAILLFVVTGCVAGASAPMAHVPSIKNQPIAVGVMDFAPIPAEAVGMLITDDGRACSFVAIEPEIALTAGHCVLNEDMTFFTGKMVGFAFGKHGESTLIAEFERVWVDPAADIAIIHAKTGRFYDTVKIHQELPVKDEPMWIVGYGCDSDWPHLKAYRSYRPGRFEEYNAAQAGYLFYGHACHGDSGGAIMSATGELIGIVSAANDHYILAPLASEALPGLLLN